MPEFTKRPLRITAEHWDGSAENATPLIDWMLDNDGSASYWHENERGLQAPASIAIWTLEGWMYASPGDWIIRGIAGEFYPCKPGIFADTYEEALDAEHS